MTQVVRSAVFPVAGRGTRFLPATKASPKEMLPIVDKPLIQYAVEEALEAGIDLRVVDDRQLTALDDEALWLRTSAAPRRLLDRSELTLTAPVHHLNAAAAVATVLERGDQGRIGNRGGRGGPAGTIQ